MTVAETYIDVVRRRLPWVVLGTLVVLVLGSVFLSGRSAPLPSYQAEVIIETPDSVDADEGRGAEAARMTSDRVIAIAQDRLNADGIDLSEITGRIRVDIPEDSDLVGLRLTGDDEATVELIVSEIAEAYVVVSETDIRATRDARRDRLAAEIALLDQQLTDESTIVATLDEDSVEVRNSAAMVEVIQSQLIRLRTDQSLAAVQDLGSASLISGVETTETTGRQIPAAAALGAIAALALMFGIALAFFAHRLDRTVRSPREASAIAGSQILGAVPWTAPDTDNSSLPDQFLAVATLFRAFEWGSGSDAVLAIVGDRKPSRVVENVVLGYVDVGGSAVVVDRSDGALIRQALVRPDAHLEVLDAEAESDARDYDEDTSLFVVTKGPLVDAACLELARQAGVLVVVVRIGSTKREELATVTQMAAANSDVRLFVIAEERKSWRHRAKPGRRGVASTAAGPGDSGR